MAEAPPAVARTRQLTVPCLYHVALFLNFDELREFATVSRVTKTASRRRLGTVKPMLENVVQCPFTGLEHAVRASFAADTPASKAALLYRAHQVVPPKVIGVAICPRRGLGISSDEAWDAAVPMADAYLSHFDFDGVNAVDAVRTVLLRTAVPNSSIALAFLLKAIARRYFDTAVLRRPGVWPASNFKRLDAVYLLMYTAVILNGNLRAPALKAHQRMTKAQFVSTNSRVELMEGIAVQCLEEVYDNVAAWPLPMSGWKTQLDAPTPSLLSRVRTATSGFFRSVTALLPGTS